MPALEHNGLVEMFRENPGLAPYLLETVLHRDVPPHASLARSTSFDYSAGMNRACLGRAAALLLVFAAFAASACAAGEPPPALVAAAEPSPSRPATLQPRVTFSPLPASVRDARRFANKSLELSITEIQGLESIFAVTPAGAADRPALMRRLAGAYSELEHVAETDRAGAPAASPRAGKAAKIVSAARTAAIRYNRRLARDYPQWCAAPPMGCTDESLYYAALDHERARQLDDARSLYLELIQHWPQSRFVPLAFMGFGETFFDQAQQDSQWLELAKNSYGKVVQHPPPENPVYGYGEYRLGQIHGWQGEGALARAHLQKAATHAQASGDAALGALVAETLRALEPPAKAGN